jgi:hypothetical protein
MSQEIPVYSAVSAALESAGSDLSAAEGHGLLCALLCAAPARSEERWLAEVLPRERGEPVPAVDPHGVLRQLREASDAQLAGPDGDLRLLLPGDDAPLAWRAEALAQWCAAFLYGLGLAGPEGEPVTPDVREVLRDLADISRLEADGDAQEDERAFVEVTEFVRVAVMLVYEELRGPDRPGWAGRVH